jgi:hypothetical protein
MDGYEDLPDKAKTTDPYADIPTQGRDVKAPAPTRGEESDFGRVMRKAGEAATAVGPVGVAAGGALRAVSRAPQAVQAGAGAIERGARGLAQALTPTSLRQLGGMVGSAGLAGGAAEVARQYAERAGAGQTGQRVAETLGAITPAAAGAATRRAAAPIVEKVGKRLTTPYPEFETPQKAAARQTLTEADIKLLPSEIRESKPLKAVERIFQLLPGSREEFAKIGRENQQAVNLAIAKAFGGTQPTLAPQAMAEARKSLTDGYGALLDKKTFKVSPQVSDQLKTAFAQNEQLREFAVGNPKVSQFASSIDAGDTLSGQLWKEVRSEIARYVSRLDGPSKITGRQVLQQFDNIAQNNLSKAEHDVLKGIDRKYAALSSFEDAFRRNPAILRAGDADLTKFAQQYASVEPMNILYGRTMGRGGEFVPLSEAGQAYRVFTSARVPETQATTLGGLGRVATGMSLMGGGLAGGIPYLPAAGATYLAAPPIARGLARAYTSPEATATALRQTEISPVVTIPMFTGRQEQQ